MIERNMTRGIGKKLFRKEKLWSYVFIAPICLQFVVFTLLPMIFSVYYSFTDYNIISNTKNLLGFGNYAALLNDVRFTKAVGNTVFLMLGLPIGMVLSLLLASALNKKLPGRMVYRIIFYLPAVSSALAIGIVWKWMFNADYGVINNLFGLHVKWLVDPKTVKLALIIKGVWGGLGGTMLLYLASMQNISESYYEAADIEGANAFQKLMKITLPLITPVTFYILITGIIGGMNAFADNYIIVSGEAANTVVYYMWDKMKTGDYGLVSAASVLLGGAVFIVTFIQFKFSNKWVYGN